MNDSHNVFISVVSHGHGELISKLDILNNLSKDFNVVIKNNKHDEIILDYISSGDAIILDESYGLGFGENNNYIFNYCKEKLKMTDDDYFIVLNPDLIIDYDTIKLTIKRMKENGHLFSTINLYKDSKFEVEDQCVRKYPNFINFVSSILGFGNSSIIDKNNLNNNTPIEWCAGSFMAFKSYHYYKLLGFDVGYFMYCEDVDICYRSNLMNEPVMFYKDIKAIHLAQHTNRKIFSKNFLWHLKSAFRFLLSKNNLIKSKSNIC